jgi:hypothetical protein
MDHVVTAYFHENLQYSWIDNKCIVHGDKEQFNLWLQRFSKKEKIILSLLVPGHHVPYQKFNIDGQKINKETVLYHIAPNISVDVDEISFAYFQDKKKNLVHVIYASKALIYQFKNESLSLDVDEIKIIPEYLLKEMDKPYIYLGSDGYIFATEEESCSINNPKLIDSDLIHSLIALSKCEVFADQSMSSSLNLKNVRSIEVSSKLEVLFQKNVSKSHINLNLLSGYYGASINFKRWFARHSRNIVFGLATFVLFLGGVLIKINHLQQESERTQNLINQQIYEAGIEFGQGNALSALRERVLGRNFQSKRLMNVINLLADSVSGEVSINNINWDGHQLLIGYIFNDLDQWNRYVNDLRNQNLSFSENIAQQQGQGIFSTQLVFQL